MQCPCGGHVEKFLFCIGVVEMRKCCQCQCDMTEGFDIKIDRGGYGIKITLNAGVFAKRIEKPKVAICPQCGEISLYIENLDDIKGEGK